MEGLERSQVGPSHTHDVFGDMVDDIEAAPTSIEKGGNRKRGIKVVVTTI